MQTTYWTIRQIPTLQDGLLKNTDVKITFCFYVPPFLFFKHLESFLFTGNVNKCGSKCIEFYFYFSQIAKQKFSTVVSRFLTELWTTSSCMNSCNCCLFLNNWQWNQFPVALQNNTIYCLCVLKKKRLWYFGKCNVCQTSHRLCRSGLERRVWICSLCGWSWTIIRSTRVRTISPQNIFTTSSQQAPPPLMVSPLKIWRLCGLNWSFSRPQTRVEREFLAWNTARNTV